ncbi:CsbD family protein [Streptomyces guryensis]|uniref:CsbD family protein n=1 Tax=Streptomyces guryensis TaxID=2886947 RepID=UPI003555D0AE
MEQRDTHKSRPQQGGHAVHPRTADGPAHRERQGGRTLTGSTVQGHATPEHTAEHSAFPPRPDPAGTHLPDNSEAGMTVSRTIRNQAQTMKGRITEELGRVTRNRRLQRRGRIDRVSGSLKQAVEKTKDAFRRNGSGPR